MAFADATPPSECGLEAELSSESTMTNEHASQAYDAQHREEQSTKQRESIQSGITLWYRTCSAPDSQ
jgi:hypothetical protein